MVIVYSCLFISTSLPYQTNTMRSFSNDHIFILSTLHSKCSVKALWRKGWNEDRRRTLSFFKRRFWRKGERGWLACIWKGKIYLRVGKNPSRFEKETRDSGEEADQMQMRRRMREYDSRNMECGHQPDWGWLWRVWSDIFPSEMGENISGVG